MQNCESAMHALCESFAPIFAAWDEADLMTSAIWQKVKGKSQAQILEEDVLVIGNALSNCDELGGSSEMALLAECVAHIRLRESNLPVAQLLDNEIEKTLKKLPSMLPQDNALKTPVTWEIGCKMVKTGHVGDVRLNLLRQAWMDVADVFVLRDGNLTQGETKAMQELDALLST